MPYELEYKKVHNTFKPKGLDNVFGYMQGQVANVLDIEDPNMCFLYLTEERQQFVIQNMSLEDSYITIRIYDVNGAEINFENYSPLHVWIETLLFGESIVLETPTNQAVYQNGVKRIPDHIVLTSQKEYAVWPTYNSICGTIDENNIIVSNSTVTPLYNKIETLDWAEINDFINGCSLTITEDANNYTIEVTEGRIACPASIHDNGFDVVLVPVKYGKGPLKSITNMRNSRQFSLYGLKGTSDYKYQKVSLYLEPISLLNSAGTWIGTKSFSKNITGPLSLSYFTPTKSKQGFWTYGLKAQYSSLAMFVCKGCGYMEGSKSGVTKISFAIGIQEKKATAPHSGCSLSIIKKFNSYIELPRIALARTDNTNCVIAL